MYKPITEAEAWQLVADEYEANRTSVFLCLAVANTGARSSALIEKEIPRALRDKMESFIGDMLGGSTFAYDDTSRGGEGWKARLTALTLFAAMAETRDAARAAHGWRRGTVDEFLGGA